MAWLLFIRDHPLDIDADARRFYGTTLDEMFETLDGPTFFGLTYRLSAYDGAVTKRLQQLSPQEEVEEVELDQVPAEFFSHAVV
jgi:hypothetical protein